MVQSLRIQLKDELARRFRKSAMESFGYHKGALSEAAEVALEDWVKRTNIIQGKKSFSPTDMITGLLKGINIDSVELQHLASKIRIKKSLENVSN